ncbi:ABC transporter permease [Geminicoccus harenae]|uniref:ABC transporter permease n=1 Tax=Geminicoccus harenae TaxID=2498453 RepID=UPI00168B7E8D|nr:ABC transporter permease [Geminicoccus harenae]
MNEIRRPARWLYGTLIALVLLFVYLPMMTLVMASFSRSKFFKFPIPQFATNWYADVFASLSIRSFFWTSLVIALLVATIATVLAFFGALAFARYRWAGRKLYQKILLLPILFPQAVLGLALLLWFSAIGVTPSWQAAVFAHLVWIAPITTLVIAIQVYAFDPAMEEAAVDLGATRWQTLKEVTLPILTPGIVSGFLSAFLLSWANFPLSMFSTGADQTIPEWISAKIQSGYTPQVPAVGTLTMLAAVIVMALGGFAAWLHARRRAGLA